MQEMWSFVDVVTTCMCMHLYVLECVHGLSMFEFRWVQLVFLN